MTTQNGTCKELAKEAGCWCGHALAVVGGLVLMVVGVALGVSLVLLPIGVPVGLAGLGLFLWGLFRRSGDTRAPE